jgi:hypothetical protein
MNSALENSREDSCLVSRLPNLSLEQKRNSGCHPQPEERSGGGCGCKDFGLEFKPRDTAVFHGAMTDKSSEFLKYEVTSPTTSRGVAAPVEGGTRSAPDDERPASRMFYSCRRFFRGTATAWLRVTTLDASSRARRMQSPTRGYSLLELLVYVAVFAVAVNIFVSLLGTGSQLSALNTLSMSRMEGVREVQEEFTEYTRRASVVVPEVGEYKTGPDRIVLKMPPGQEEGFDYAVLGVLREANRFAVMGLAEKEGALEVVYMKTLRQPLETLLIEVDGSGSRPMVNLRVKVQGEEGERKQPFVEHTASATPRGVGG